MKKILSYTFRLTVLVTAAILLAVFSSCKARTAETGHPVIAVSILPQAWFLQRIGGERITALVLVGPGQNPHSYEPTPRQMSDLASAKAWILSGTDFELALEPKIRALYPSLPITDGTEGVIFRHMEKHSHEGESSAEEAGHTEAAGEHDIELDRHTWLGREPAKIMAGHIRDTLASIDPAGLEIYEGNYLSLISEIDTTFDRLTVSLEPLRGSSVFVFHPSFGYFLDEFGIGQEAVETGGKEPTAQALASLIDEAMKDKPSAIFVQAQFPATAARTIADAAGAKVIPLDPLAPDWLANIEYMGEVLHENGTH